MTNSSTKLKSTHGISKSGAGWKQALKIIFPRRFLIKYSILYTIYSLMNKQISFESDYSLPLANILKTWVGSVFFFYFISEKNATIFVVLNRCVDKQMNRLIHIYVFEFIYTLDSVGPKSKNSPYILCSLPRKYVTAEIVKFLIFFLKKFFQFLQDARFNIRMFSPFRFRKATDSVEINTIETTVRI